MEAMGALVDTGDLAPQQLAFVASAKADVTSDIVHGIRNMQTLRGSHPDAFAKAVNHLLTSTQHRSFPSFLPAKKNDSVSSSMRNCNCNPRAVKHNWLPAQ